jgi:hypothetical protein
MKTPVAFIIFNRPDTAKKVFEAIRQVKPPKLFVIADGPRANHTGDTEKCASARAIIDGVDWECEVLINYSDINLGCKIRVSSGLDWVFNIVEEAIILEDDCLPHPSFFPFCEDLLDYYRNDTRIMAVCGGNFQFGRNRNNYSYYFSRYVHVWGWASWRRAWQNYDVDIKLWKEVSDCDLLPSILEDTKTLKYWNKTFQNTYDGLIDTWDHQLTFTFWSQNGLTILPNSNLVSNIGFREDATHTKGNSEVANIPTEAIDFPLKHPPFMMRNIQADKYTEKIQFSATLLNRVKRKLISIFKLISLINN